MWRSEADMRQLLGISGSGEQILRRSRTKFAHFLGGPVEAINTGVVENTEETMDRKPAREEVAPKD